MKIIRNIDSTNSYEKHIYRYNRYLSFGLAFHYCRSDRNRLRLVPGIWLHILQSFVVCADGFLLQSRPLLGFLGDVPSRVLA